MEALFQVHHRRLVGLAALLVDDRESAEEIVQDAFESLYKRWNRLRDRTRPSPTSIAASCTAPARGSDVGSRHGPTSPPDAGTAPSAESLGIDATARELLAEAIRALPRRQREVVVLRYFLDLSEDQIAAWLGISAGSVKQHQSRATASLHKRMEAWA